MNELLPLRLLTLQVTNNKNFNLQRHSHPQGPLQPLWIYKEKLSIKRIVEKNQKMGEAMSRLHFSNYWIKAIIGIKKLFRAAWNIE